jgi:hydrogenase maturation protein HypF
MKAASARSASGVPPARASSPQQARRLVVGGQVQGVGFRPYVYRHAAAHRLQGWVRNRSGRVEIHVQGEPRRLERFVATLLDCAPPLSRPVLASVEAVARCDADRFSIRSSRADAAADVHLPPDLFTCDDCLRELNDPADRRFRYPFINCTQCGPRYSLIEALPYDRVNTSMASFPLCAACAAEYRDPSQRRHHAEPVACETCGPQLTFVANDAVEIKGNAPALQAALAALADGKLLAIKGVGGYHLACDAAADAAVTRLRANKPRPHKPLAVMFPAPAGKPLASVRRYLDPDAVESELLVSAARPVVLVRRRPGDGLSAAIAPGLDEVGAMLPYSPLHHLLLNDYGAPLVMTSANISGEPVLTDNDEVERRLARVADACLHHDRPIVHAVDDSVVRVMAGRPRPLRLGRGIAPLEIELPFEVGAPLLAVGAQMKNTIALAWDRRAVISPHIGECAESLQALYQVKAESIVCDAHSGFTTTRWALGQGMPVHRVYHHHAHASAAWLDGAPGTDGDALLVFTWDGVGLGPDATLWGGEALPAGQARRLAKGRYDALFSPARRRARRSPALAQRRRPVLGGGSRVPARRGRRSAAAQLLAPAPQRAADQRRRQAVRRRGGTLRPGGAGHFRGTGADAAGGARGRLRGWCSGRHASPAADSRRRSEHRRLGAVAAAAARSGVAGRGARAGVPRRAGADPVAAGPPGSNRSWHRARRFCRRRVPESRAR